VDEFTAPGEGVEAPADGAAAEWPDLDTVEEDVAVSEWPEPEMGVEGEATADDLAALRGEAEEAPERGFPLLRLGLVVLAIAVLAVAAVLLVQSGVLGGAAPAATATSTVTPEPTETPTDTPAPATATATSTATPTAEATRTPAPSRTPEPTDTEAPTPTQETLATSETADETPAAIQVASLPTVDAALLTDAYQSELYTVAYPDGWARAVSEDDALNTEVILARGATVPGPSTVLPDDFTFATVTTVAITNLEPADLVALSRVSALSLVDERGEVSDVERGGVTIGGRPGAFDYYTVTGPQGTVIYVYAAAAVVDDSWSFSYVLFTTASDDIDIALQMLASVTFAGGN